MEVTSTCIDSAVCRGILNLHEDEHCVERDKELVRAKDVQQGDIEDEARSSLTTVALKMVGYVSARGLGKGCKFQSLILEFGSSLRAAQVS